MNNDGFNSSQVKYAEFNQYKIKNIYKNTITDLKKGKIK